MNDWMISANAPRKTLVNIQSAEQVEAHSLAGPEVEDASDTLTWVFGEPELTRYVCRLEEGCRHLVSKRHCETSRGGVAEACVIGVFRET